MFRALFSIYRPLFATTIVYMLQSSEYNVSNYLKWFLRTNDFSKVMYRRHLVKTKPAKMLLNAFVLGVFLQVVVSGYLFYRTIHIHHSITGSVIVAAFLLSAPIAWAYLITVPLFLGRWLIIKPRNWWITWGSKTIFANHPATKIAVAGSYGKTTVKELLVTVLSEGKKVAATPGNKNVPSEHAKFARKLKGDEEILIIEYGEGAPGDVPKFARITRPNVGVITGLAPAHLDKYKTLHRAGTDIFGLADYLKGEQVYVNGECDELKPFVKEKYHLYSNKGVLDWKVSDIKSSLDGVSFKMANLNETLSLKSDLVGQHQISSLVLVAALAYQLGLSKAQIEKGVSKTKPFEHRMQPQKVDGAWVIDDTYNGNIEGMKAGLALLKELPAKRKIYVTPGLVDQGSETMRVHHELGKTIVKTDPDMTVLMRNSVTDYILTGLKEDGYGGELLIEDDPLNFYTNLSQFVATGDLVLMQNDWPDNYN
jgi:UDP-N-acetylmuramoyl-tripeptide--D-alanyl-D-alanine ligase